MPGGSSTRSRSAGLASRGQTLQTLDGRTVVFARLARRAVEDHPLPVDPDGKTRRRARLEPDGVRHRRERSSLPSGILATARTSFSPGSNLATAVNAATLALRRNRAAVDQQRDGRLRWAARTGSRERLLPRPGIAPEEIERDRRGDRRLGIPRDGTDRRSILRALPASLGGRPARGANLGCSDALPAPRRAGEVESARRVRPGLPPRETFGHVRRYPFIAPAIRPRVRARCSKKKKTSAGRQVRMPAAMM